MVITLLRFITVILTPRYEINYVTLGKVQNAESDTHFTIRRKNYLNSVVVPLCPSETPQ